MLSAGDAREMSRKKKDEMNEIQVRQVMGAIEEYVKKFTNKGEFCISQVDNLWSRCDVEQVVTVKKRLQELGYKLEKINGGSYDPDYYRLKWD